MGLAESIQGSLAKGGDAEAIEFEGRWISWRRLVTVIDALDRALDKAGCGRGAPVGLVIRNRPPQTAALLGLIATYRCCVLLNPFQAPERLADEIRRLDLCAVVGDPEDMDAGVVDAAVRDKQAVSVVLDPALSPAALQVRDYRQQGRAAVSMRPDIVLDMPTSGTSGTPKRIGLTFQALSLAIEDHAAIAREMGEAPASLLPEATLIQYAPILHIGGLYVALQMGLECRRMVLLEKFSAAEWHRAVKLYRPRITGMPPAIIRIVLEADIPSDDVSSVRAVRSGAAPLDAETKRLMQTKLGIVALPVYGATEYAGIIASWSLEEYLSLADQKPGSVGRIRKAVATVRVLDPDTDQEVTPGGVGQISILVPRMSSEWIKTTDLGAVDTDGFLYIHGRADNAINRGGFKIVPDSVVSVLRQHPSVFDAAVVALDDARLGQVPVAAIELRPGMPVPDTAELEQFARNNLSKYQVPTKFLIVNALPRTPAEKVMLPAVRALFASQAAVAPMAGDQTVMQRARGVES